MCPKLSELLSWNGPTVHVCRFMLARASTKTFVSRIHIRQPNPYSLAESKKQRKNLRQPKNSLAVSLASRDITVVYFTKLSADFLRLDGAYGTANDEMRIRKDSNEAVVAESWHSTVICAKN